MRACLAVLFGAVLICVGCGGGGGGSKGAPVSGASFKIVWPAKTRDALVHGLTSARSASVTFKNGGGAGKDITVNVDREASIFSYTGTYPVGQDIMSNVSSMTAKFYSDAGEQGALVGSASSAVKVQGTSLEMSAIKVAGTVKKVSILPPPAINLGDDMILLQASAVDGSGTTLAVDPGSFNWSLVSGSSVLLLRSDGGAQALSAGDATLKVTVDGVTSTQLTVTIAAKQVQIVPIAVNRMALNAANGDLWATVRSSDARYPHSLVRIHPNNGAIDSTVDTVKEPNLIAISSGGDTAFATIPEDGTISEADIKYFESVSYTQPVFSGVIDLAALPGSALGFVTLTDPSAGPNAKIWQGDAGQTGIGNGGYRMVFAADGSAMYGDGNDTLFQNSLGSAGFTPTGQKSVNVSGCVLSKGLLYTNAGTVVNPVSGAIVETLPHADFQQYNFVSVSAADNRIYYLTASGNGDVKMLSFDQTTYEEKPPLSLGHIPGALHDPIACGSHMVAFESTAGEGQGVVIIRGLP
ncbi:MAG TPA: hypothetical protein VG944_22300 [Fimbriimonas sp.]|nr:hypothetical protein [Fimbriimonas sp.]